MKPKHFPDTTEFLERLDEEDVTGGKVKFLPWAERLVEEGFHRIHLLYDETPESLLADPIRLPYKKGELKQLIMLVKSECDRIRRELKGS